MTSGVVPAWSVPPGLIDPDHPAPRRQLPTGAPRFSEARDENRPAEPAGHDDAWPGVAQPARWFLRAAADPGHHPPNAMVPAPRREPDGSWSTPAKPAPRREPDGSWSTAVTSAQQALGASPARWGRAGGLGFQPGPVEAGQATAELSPWQRSQRRWHESGIQWEPAALGSTGSPPRPQPSAPRPQPSAPVQVPQPRQSNATQPVPMAAALSAPVFTDTEPGQHGEGRQDAWAEDRNDAWAEGRQDAWAEGPQDAWAEDRNDAWAEGPQDAWAEDRPPIWERPANLVPPARPRASDTLLLDPARPGPQPPGPQPPGPRRPGARRGLVTRRTATIAVPAIVLVAVAVLALALLMGHGPKFGSVSSSSQQGSQNTGSPQSPQAAGGLATYPGQQQRGVFQTVTRIVASGRTMVSIGSLTSDGVVRQQFFVSSDSGATWHLAPVRAVGGQGAQALPGHPAVLLAGGQGGWLAVGPQATWTSPDGLSWTLAATHGISPQLPGDSVWVITKTAQGYLAAGAGPADRGAGQAVIWTSRDGLTWQRMTAGQLGLAAPGEAVLNISHATSHGDATVISGQVARGGATYSAGWLSTDGGAAWTRVAIPADHGAGPAISGLGFDAAGLIAVRPGRSAAGAVDGVAYFSPNGQAWQYAGTIDPAGGWSPGVVKGSDNGFVVTGATTAGTIVAYTSTGTGATWLPTGPLGDAATASVVSATVGPSGTVVAVGYTAPSKLGQQPVFLEASTAGTVRPVPLAGIPGAIVPELAINGLAVAGGQQMAVGSADGYPAVWRKSSGGSWSLVSSLPLVSAYPGLRALASVTHGAAGWLAVGAPGPVILSSADGTTWRAAAGSITQALAGVSAVAAAAGPAGYVIVGKLVAPGGSCIADVWWSPDLTRWTRARDVNDATGSSQVLAVAADAHGFVSAGSHEGKPALWTTTNGRLWNTIVLQLPAGAATAVLQQIAISGNRVAALGQAITAGGATAPLAEVSADGGTTWQQVPFSSPGPDTAFTALTAGSRGFTAAGLFGRPGQQHVAVWTSADGTRWSEVPGVPGGGITEITSLAPSGSVTVGTGSIETQQGRQIAMLTLP